MENVVIRVERGEPTPEELAALVTVLSARATDAVEPPRAEPARRWAASARPAAGRFGVSGGAHRPGAWRTSALPR